MRIGIVGDLHAPFIHPMYRRFCMDTFQSWNVDHVHLAGDVVDNHALSFHDHDPNGMSAEDEARSAVPYVKQWHRTFPGATVCIGNHDERHYRIARKAGMPDRYLRGYADVWNTPEWDWRHEFIYDDVLLQHGTGTSGKNAAINAAIESRCSIAQGHVHGWGAAVYHTNPTSRIFGLNVGCGIDCRWYAFAYGKVFKTRPTLGCGIVIDGHFAIFIPMPCGKGEKYHRSRAGRKKSRR